MKKSRGTPIFTIFGQNWPHLAKNGKICSIFWEIPGGPNFAKPQNVDNCRTKNHKRKKNEKVLGHPILAQNIAFLAKMVKFERFLAKLG